MGFRQVHGIDELHFDARSRKKKEENKTAKEKNKTEPDHGTARPLDHQTTGRRRGLNPVVMTSSIGLSYLVGNPVVKSRRAP